MRFSKQNWLSASILLISLAIVSKGLGFFREVLVAYYFGASAQVDAFMVALSIPMLLAGGIGGAFSAALVPSYQKAVATAGVDQGNKVVSSALLTSSILSALVLLPLSIIPLSFVQAAAPSLPKETAQLAAGLTRWLSLFVFGQNLVFILGAFFHAFHHFKIPAIADLVFNVMTIFSLVGLAVTLGIQAIVLGNIAGTALCLLILIGFLTRKGWRFATFTLKSSDIEAGLVLAFPVLMFEFSSQLGTMIENYYGSGLSEGSIAALNYAKRITTPIILVLALNIARGIYPTLASMSLEKKSHEAKLLVEKVSKHLLILIAPIAAVLICYRKEILSILYLRGAFDDASLAVTSEAFMFYAAGLMVGVIEPVLIYTLFAFSDRWTPLLSSLVGVAVMIVLLEFLIPMLGIGGIALGMSLACLARVAVQIMCVAKRVKGLDLGGLLKIGATSLACALLAFGPSSLLAQITQAPSLNFFILIVLSSAFYLALAHVVMNEEMTLIRRGLSQGLRY